jgi:hypothetical protein
MERTYEEILDLVDPLPRIKLPTYEAIVECAKAKQFLQERINSVNRRLVEVISQLGNGTVTADTIAWYSAQGQQLIATDSMRYENSLQAANAAVDSEDDENYDGEYFYPPINYDGSDSEDENNN